MNTEKIIPGTVYLLSSEWERLYVKTGTRSKKDALNTAISNMIQEEEQ